VETTRTVIDALYEAFMAGDSDAMLDLMSDDVVVLPWSGRRTGHRPRPSFCRIYQQVCSMSWTFVSNGR